MGIYFPADDRIHQPVDWRIVGLHKTIAYMLGIEPKEIRPTIAPKNKERQIKEPYVCIATQSTSQAKYWNHPTGWYETIKYLKEKGYRVINYHVCNGCWNDTSLEFDHKDFEWCPRHKGDERHYECTRFISPEQVIKTIARLMKDYNLIYN